MKNSYFSNSFQQSYLVGSKIEGGEKAKKIWHGFTLLQISLISTLMENSWILISASALSVFP